jgi:hypothetical protein
VASPPRCLLCRKLGSATALPAFACSLGSASALWVLFSFSLSEFGSSSLMIKINCFAV